MPARCDILASMQRRSPVVRTKYFEFAELVQDGGVLTRLQIMYDVARSIECPTILELGTQRGRSATVFLKACQERDGHLVSVDVRDCSDVSECDRFTFVQSDSTDVDAIIAAAPILKQGIDLLYVDSRHLRKHVEKETYGWFPYMKENTSIFYDDVDPLPFRKGQPRNNPVAERNFDGIRDFIECLFYANSDTTSLRIYYGGTGLACLSKHSQLGAIPKPALKMPKRLFFEPLMYNIRRKLHKLRDRWDRRNFEV